MSAWQFMEIGEPLNRCLPAALPSGYNNPGTPDAGAPPSRRPLKKCRFSTAWSITCYLMVADRKQTANGTDLMNAITPNGITYFPSAFVRLDGLCW